MSDFRDFAPARTDDPAPGASAAAMSAQIGLVAQRQEELARAVQRLGTSAAEFDQLRGYVEQIGVILANVAKEVAAQDVTTVQRRVDDLAETVSEVDTLRAEVAAVAEVAENLATAQGHGPASWWPDLATGDSRAQALENLGVWVDEVLRTRHPEMYNKLGGCWSQHADVLDELTALRAAWYAAYRDPEAPATAAIEWHDRWLPGRCPVPGRDPGPRVQGAARKGNAGRRAVDGPPGLPELHPARPRHRRAGERPGRPGERGRAPRSGSGTGYRTDVAVEGETTPPPE